MNWEHPDDQAGFRKGREARDQIPNIRWIIEQAREFQKNIYFFIDYTKASDCVDHNKLWILLKEMRMPDHLTCLLQNLKQHLELDIKQRTGSKLGNDYVKAVDSHHAYLTYVQSTSF